MTIPLVLLCLSVGAALGIGIMAALTASRRSDDCADCTRNDCAAWQAICAGLSAKGWTSITPELIVALAPVIFATDAGPYPDA